MRWVIVAALAGLGGVSAFSPATASDLERARRDADKVFSFIKFHSVKRVAPARPPTPQGRQEPKLASKPSPQERASVPPQLPEASVLKAAAEAAESAQSGVVPMSAAAPATPGRPTGSAPTESPPAPTARVAEPESQSPVPTAAASEAEDGEAAPLRLREFVAPELSPSLLASLGASMPRVRLRFSVEADGRVSSAAAREGTPRRIAVVAERALLQWRFEALPAAQDAEVELVFQRG